MLPFTHFLLFISLLLEPSRSCGASAHIEVTHRAHYMSSLKRSLAAEIAGEYLPYLEAGSFVPGFCIYLRLGLRMRHKSR
jgi:hypothetical protein